MNGRFVSSIEKWIRRMHIKRPFFSHKNIQEPLPTKPTPQENHRAPDEGQPAGPQSNTPGLPGGGSWHHTSCLQKPDTELVETNTLD